MAQWWEHLPPTNAARVQTPVLACGLSLLLVLSLAARGFSPGTLVFPSHQKPTIPNFNSTRNQVDEEPLRGCATSKSLFIIHYKGTAAVFNIVKEELTVEKSAFKPFRVVIRPLSTRFEKIKLFMFHSPTDAAAQFLYKLQFYLFYRTDQTRWPVKRNQI